VVGSHLRSHPKFDKETEEMDVGTTLDADVRMPLRIGFLLIFVADNTARHPPQIHHVRP
jgi:hypothetical protein